MKPNFHVGLMVLVSVQLLMETLHLLLKTLHSFRQKNVRDTYLVLKLFTKSIFAAQISFPHQNVWKWKKKKKHATGVCRVSILLHLWDIVHQKEKSTMDLHSVIWGTHCSWETVNWLGETFTNFLHITTF